MRARASERLLLKPDPRGSIIRVPSRAGVLPASDPRALRSSGSGVRHGVHASRADARGARGGGAPRALHRVRLQDGRDHARERLLQNHRVNRALDEMVSKTKRLRAAYEDADGARAEEIAALGGAGEEAYGAFYDRLKETREYHRAYPGFHAPTSEDFLAPFKSDRAPEFSGEEHGGRYLDLHAAHHAFQNAPSDARRTTSRTSPTSATSRPSLATRNSARRTPATSTLADYLRSFHRRVRPLVFLEKITAKAEQEFERQWNEGAVPGWEDKGVRTAGGDAEANRVDLEAFATVDEMAASLSPDDVRAALGAMGLKQGGTEEQRRDRLWSTRGKSLAEMDKKLFAKGAATAGDSESAARLEAKAKAVARRRRRRGAPRAARGDAGRRQGTGGESDAWSRSSRRRRWRMMILSRGGGGGGGGGVQPAQASPRVGQQGHRTGCTSCTVSTWSSRAKSLATTRTGGVARGEALGRRGTSSARAWGSPTPRRSRRCVLTCLPASFLLFSLFLASGMMDMRTGHRCSMTHNAWA